MHRIYSLANFSWDIRNKYTSNFPISIVLIYPKKKREREGGSISSPAAEASLGGLPSHNCNYLSDVHQMASQSTIQQCLESPHPLN
jgi:hypothetical protein